MAPKIDTEASTRQYTAATLVAALSCHVAWGCYPSVSRYLQVRGEADANVRLTLAKAASITVLGGTELAMEKCNSSTNRGGEGRREGMELELVEQGSAASEGEEKRFDRYKKLKVAALWGGEVRP